MTPRARQEGLTTKPMTFAIALVVAFGGIVVPFIGWIAGIAMMWLSSVWPRTTKVLVTLIPLAAFAVLALLIVASAPNPVPGGAVTFILVALTPIATGSWLLVAGLRVFDEAARS